MDRQAGWFDSFASRFGISNMAAAAASAMDEAVYGTSGGHRGGNRGAEGGAEVQTTGSLLRVMSAAAAAPNTHSAWALLHQGPRQNRWLTTTCPALAACLPCPALLCFALCLQMTSTLHTRKWAAGGAASSVWQGSTAPKTPAAARCPGSARWCPPPACPCGPGSASSDAVCSPRLAATSGN